MMPDRFKTDQKIRFGPSWRDYQSGLRRSAAKKRMIKNILKTGAVLFVLIIGFYGIIEGLDRVAYHHTQKVDKPRAHHERIGKKAVQTLLGRKTFLNLMDKSLDCIIEGRNFRIDTSLDIPLQKFILRKINRSTSRYIGIVVMEPSTGRILSMVGFDKTNPAGNPCIDNRFPAASIFKIITAAAAIEKCGFNQDSRFTYNGRKYTLYKSQLKERINRYTNKITFRDSFAQSINPVFGKIGTHCLGKNTLKQYAEAFGFNRNIDFEIPLAPSNITLTDEPYHWAEIASGFNRETTLSPLHGALLISTILNKGKLIEPTIVDQILDENGQILYRSHFTTINQAISARTSEIVNCLMEATIISGTSRKAFMGRRKDRVLSRLSIGAKTGSIDNNTHDARYDWFVGFAKEKKGPGKIAISIVVAHEKYIGTRASHYARIAIKKYFRNYFADKESNTVTDRRL